MRSGADLLQIVTTQVVQLLQLRFISMQGFQIAILCPADRLASKLQALDLRTNTLMGHPGTDLAKWAPSLRRLAFDWQDRTNSAVNYLPLGALSSTGFPLDPSLRMSGRPITDLMESIPR